MDRKARTHRTRAVALTSPAPARVSVCGAGANQTPFNTVKSDGLTLVEKKDLEPMITSLKAQGFDVVSFAFKGENWTTEAVTGWLNDGGYVGFKVEGTDGDITVTSEEPADWMADAEKREITTDEGVTVIVGKMPEAEPAAEPEAAPAAVDAGSEVQPVASDKAEEPAAEPEAAEKTDAADEAEAAVANAFAVLKQASALPEERRKGFYEIRHVADLISTLRWLVNDATYELFWADAEETDERKAVLDALKNAGGWMLHAFAILCAVEMDELAEVFGLSGEATKDHAEPTPDGVADAAAKTETSETPAEPEAATAEVAKTDEPSPEAEAPAQPQPEEVTDPVVAAVMKMLEPLTSGLAEVTASVATLAAQVNGTTADKADAPEEPAPAERQTRKSEDTDGPVNTGTPATPTTTEGQQASKRVADLRLRGSLGL